MTKKDSTPVDGVSSTLLPVHRLARLEDQLNQLLACHTFYDLAIKAITSPDYEEDIDGKQWHFGLLLQQQWLQDQGQAVITELQTIRRVLHE
ncbi:MAG: hypothetical protein ACI9SP_004760 [Arenicella sp.]